MDPGTVIAAAALTQEFLKNLLDSMASVNRKIAIGIENGTPYKCVCVKPTKLHCITEII